MSSKNATKNNENKHLQVGIPDVDENFNLHKKIGSGTFSSVYLASLKSQEHVNRENRKYFAIKRLIPTSSPKRIEQELKCLINIGGLNNVGGIEACVRYQDSVAFIMPYLAHDKFHEYFDKMDLAEIRSYMKNLLIALRHVHSFNIIHRDVKPSNFLYNRKEKKFMLVDFGLAQEVKKEEKKDESNEKSTTKNPTNGSVASRKQKIQEVIGDEGENENIGNPRKRMRLDENVENNKNEPKETKMNNIPTKESIQNKEPLFKSPLKMSNIGNLPNYFATPLATAVKSTCIGLSVNLRMMGKERPAPKTSSSTTKISDNICYCYGKSQVCNICIVKKEVQASRAGTPGYRPPEVLLKFPNQNTAVDIWAVGVIFLSILSKSYPFFKAHDDFNALAEMITVFGDKKFKRLALGLERHIKIGHKCPALNMKKMCILLRNRNPTKITNNVLIKNENETTDKIEPITNPIPGPSTQQQQISKDCEHCRQNVNYCLCANSAIIPSIHGADDFPPEAYDLLSLLLELDPKKRITAEDALKHKFFTDEE